MTTIALWIYIGGVFAVPDRKVGFLKRVFWPGYLGEMIAERVYAESNRAPK